LARRVRTTFFVVLAFFAFLFKPLETLAQTFDLFFLPPFAFVAFIFVNFFLASGLLGLDRMGTPHLYFAPVLVVLDSSYASSERLSTLIV
jgi:hypothetical protein